MSLLRLSRVKCHVLKGLPSYLVTGSSTALKGLEMSPDFFRHPLLNTHPVNPKRTVTPHLSTPTGSFEVTGVTPGRCNQLQCLFWHPSV